MENTRKKHTCEFCGFQGKSQEDVLKHTRLSHNTHRKKTIFTCNKCLRSFSRKSTLKRHLLHCCKCKVCNEFSTDQTDFEEHKKNCFLAINCEYCSKSFLNQKKLTDHKKKCSAVFCSSCQKLFHSPDELETHYASHKTLELLKKSRRSSFTCGQCGSKFDDLNSLKAHEISKNHARAGSSKEKISRNFDCRKCKQSFPNRSELYFHQRHYHEQSGAGSDKTNFQSPIWEAENRKAPWEDESGKVIDNELKTMYDLHKSLILQKNEKGKLVKVYNFSIDNGVTANDFFKHLDEIYQEQDNAFRINMSFGFILVNVETKEYRFFKPYNNEEIFSNPVRISSYKQIGNLKKKVSSLDLQTYLMRQRENTKWKPVLLTNVKYVVTLTNFTLGAGGVKLPDYIHNRRCIRGFTNDSRTGDVYEDNLCMFRCLSHHLNKKPKSLERVVRKLCQRWLNHKKSSISMKNFKGVRMSEIPEFEKLFEVNINIFELKENGVAKPHFRSAKNYKINGKKNNLNLNIYENHVSYISDLGVYSSKFECRTCERLFAKKAYWKKHENICKNFKRWKFPGGYYKSNESIFDTLESYEIFVPKENRIFPWFAVFDMESLLINDEYNTQSHTFTKKHKPISVGICSNVEGFQNEYCIVEKDEKKLFTDMTEYMHKIQQKAFSLAREKWKCVFEKLNQIELQFSNTKNQDKSDEEDNDSLQREENETEPVSTEFQEKVSRTNAYYDFLKNLDNWEMQYDDFTSESEEDESDSEETNNLNTILENENEIDESDDNYTENTYENENATDESDNNYSNDSRKNENEIDESSDDVDSQLSDDEIENNAFEMLENEEENNTVCNLMSMKIKQLREKFIMYCAQIPVLGFNSSSYDLNLIKPELIDCFDFSDSKNAFIVKKGNRYLCLGNTKFKFLDICQYLPPATSYSKFLKSFEVEEKKKFFPYEWFDDENKLDYTTLPPIEAFYSSLKSQNTLESEWVEFEKVVLEGNTVEKALKILKLNDIPKTKEENYEELKKLWKDKNFKTMTCFLRDYNIADTFPFVKAVENMRKFYDDKGIDIFKSAISTPGIARKMVFSYSEATGASHSLFDVKNKDLYDKIKKNTIGGPSIIFTRHHKVDETFIRNKSDKICKKIMGFDANALYLWAIGQMLPIGDFVRRKDVNNFSPKVQTKYASAFDWLEWTSLKKGVTIKHKQNTGREKRIGPYLVDGFDSFNKTVYEYDGCYWHGHNCYLNSKTKSQKELEKEIERKKRTEIRKKFIEKCGYTVISKKECEYLKELKENPQLKQFVNERRPNFFRKNPGSVSTKALLKAILEDEIFGMFEVDIEVPEVWRGNFKNHLPPMKYFEEMSPLFATVEVPYTSFGKHMQDFVENENLSKNPRKLLIGGMKGEHLLLATPLLKWYLEHGMCVTKIHEVVEYNSAECFKQFMKDVTQARVDGDRNTSLAVQADTMKLIGNSAYGSMIMRKENHTTVIYTKQTKKATKLVNCPYFKKLTEIGNDIFEIEKERKSVKLDMPIQLGYFILQYAKLRMLQLYYDFFDVYLNRTDFEYLEMDTDSAYLALSKSNLSELIKPDLREKYLKGIKEFCHQECIESDTNFHWFPRECCSNHLTLDKRTPGLFKIEFEGDEMIGLCSKTYTVSREDCMKFSCKGINKRYVNNPMEIMKGVLESKKNADGENRGIRVYNGGVFSYVSKRIGFNYFYCKREVLEDGVHTIPLTLTLNPLKNS